MSRSARSIYFLCARVGACAFALTACGYLVVTAQRRANPVSEDALTTPVTDVVPASAPPGVDSTFLQSSKVLVMDGVDALESNAPISMQIVIEPDDPTFLLGSKSGALPSAVFEVGSEQNPGFLYSSKSPNVSSTLRPRLIPGTLPTAVPVTAPMSDRSNASGAHDSTSGAATTPEPVFLPSSKVKVLSPLRPQTTTSGTPSTSERVFLPSSKSLRIGEIKTLAPKPAPAPTEPPKNP